MTFGAERRQPACHAPGTSLYLDPSGDVRACCQNVWKRLGNVGEEPLSAIWSGRAARELRAAVAVGDFSQGCERCATKNGDGHSNATYARLYDWLGPAPEEPRWPQQLELALSNSCNLQCVMCNGDLSSAIRIHREHRSPAPVPYDDAFFDELDLFLPHLRSISFLGGEPFLGAEPLRVMDRLIELGLTPECNITTNATVWNRRVERVVRSMPTHLSFSIDGATPATFEAIRVGASHERVMHNVDQLREAALHSHGSASVSFCLMRENWHEMGAVLHWAERLGMPTFVNVVHDPPRHSFAHGPVDELRTAVETLEADREGWSARLTDSRQTWLDTLAGLRALLQGRSIPSESPVSLGHSPLPGPRRLQATLAVDQSQIVTGATTDGTEELGLDFEDLVGRSIWDTQRQILDVLGPAAASTLDVDENGSESVVVVFRHDGTRTEMSAELSTGGQGGRAWHFSFTQ